MLAARRDQGAIEWSYADGTSLTLPTITCCHCNKVTIIELKARADDCGGFCRLCMAPTCAGCADKGCTPFERRLEQDEAAGRLMAAMGL